MKQKLPMSKNVITFIVLLTLSYFGLFIFSLMTQPSISLSLVGHTLFGASKYLGLFLFTGAFYSGWLAWLGLIVLLFKKARTPMLIAVVYIYILIIGFQISTGLL
jgi:hypothetical protein